MTIPVLKWFKDNGSTKPELELKVVGFHQANSVITNTLIMQFKLEDGSIISMDIPQGALEDITTKGGFTL